MLILVCDEVRDAADGPEDVELFIEVGEVLVGGGQGEVIASCRLG
jgi:hypothetical protein